MNVLIAIRNGIVRTLYKGVCKPLLFLMDPEDAHIGAVALGKLFGKTAFMRFLTRALFSYSHESLSQTIHGMQFKNPVGLSAGFDKNAHLADILPDLGFGFAEMGSVTHEPCEGNPRPRMWRLKKTRSLVVNYGLCNDGSSVIKKRLSGKQFRIPVGISIAKKNCRENAALPAGVREYTEAYNALKDAGAYMTLNISCPNTYGGMPFTDPDHLDALLQAIVPMRSKKPIFLKLSPDMPENDIDRVVDLAMRHGIEGLICANLTKQRENPAIVETSVPPKGGISGPAAKRKANACIERCYRRAGGKLTIIGVGGIENAEDAYRKIRLGASLVQLITAMVFEGPQVMNEINRGLTRLLKRDGFASISEAVGVDAGKRGTLKT